MLTTAKEYLTLVCLSWTEVTQKLMAKIKIICFLWKMVTCLSGVLFALALRHLECKTIQSATMLQQPIFNVSISVKTTFLLLRC